MDGYSKNTAMDRDRMTQQFDPYNLYPGFEGDEFEGQGMRYYDNNSRSQKCSRRIRGGSSLLYT